MAKNNNLTDLLTAIAIAIRAKKGTQAAINPQNFDTEIAALPSPKVEQSKTMTLGSAAPTTVTPDSGKALSSVVPSIDTSVIKAENIAQGATILGIAGTHQGGGGGETGHKVYFGFAGGGDSGYLQLNGEDAQRITNYISGLGSAKNANIPSNGIRTVKMWGFDHPGTSEGTSSSFARWRIHGSNTWTYIRITRDEASATLLTLTSDIDLDIAENTCLDRNTLISMADGTKKKVKDIESGDMVKGYGGETYVVYQDENGAFAYAEERDVWTFENGYEVITCHRHRFYNYEHQAFMYLQDWAIGEHAIAEDGKMVALIGHEHQDEICHYASLWCNKSGIKDVSDNWKDGNNYYAGGLLAGNRYSEQIAVI